MSNSKFKVGDWVVYRRSDGMAVTQHPDAYRPVDGAVGYIVVAKPDRYFIVFLGGFHNGEPRINPNGQSGWWTFPHLLERWEEEKEGTP